MSAILQERCLNIGKISHSGDIYTMEISKSYKSGLLFFFFPLLETAQTRANETRVLDFPPPCASVPWWPHLQVTVLTPAHHEGLLGGGGGTQKLDVSLESKALQRERERERELCMDFLAPPWMSNLNLDPFSLR